MNKPRKLLRNSNGCYYEGNEIQNSKFAEWVWNHNKINLIFNFLSIHPIKWTDGIISIFWFEL